jgi:hypothetical protein
MQSSIVSCKGIRALALGSVLLLTACAGRGPHGGSAFSERTDSRGCSIGTMALRAHPDVARPGQLVTLTNNIRVRNGLVGTEDSGRFGRIVHRRFRASYLVIASYNSEPLPPRSVKISPGMAIAGIGVGTRPLTIVIPGVTAGNYIAEFEYSVASSTRTIHYGLRPGSYALCAQIMVK